MMRITHFLTAAWAACLISSPALAAPAPTGGKPAIMSAEREQLLRSHLPRVADEAIQKILAEPELILYTDSEMPRAYQSWDGTLVGVHLASYNISAGAAEPHGNGNREFPWSTPAGTHRCRNVTTFRFLHLPRDAQGKPRPVVWFRQQLHNDSRAGYAWRFPVGTVIGEVLGMRGKDGNYYTFEMRVRIREENDWAVNVFRPFPRAADLVTRVKELRPDWESQAELKQLVTQLSTPVNLTSRVLANGHPTPVFRQTMGVAPLPPLSDDKLIVELLTKTTFQSALGEYWIEGANGVSAAAPTTTADFHIVPANYDAGFVEVDHFSCMRCHKTVNQHVDRFQSGRDWYGRIRGSDGIFSFHPFDPYSVSGNGMPVDVRMRNEFVTKGVVEQFDARKHPQSVYTSLPQLVE